jgi:hypothetical protein
MNLNESVLLLKQPESAAIKAFLAGETEKLSSTAKERADLFLSSLDFSAARFFQKDESEKIYYVPPKKNSSLNQALIIFCNEDGTYRRASRLRYSFGTIKKLPAFSDGDFYSIFSSNINSKKGVYTFSTIDDIFLNRITIDEKGSFGFGSLKRKDKQSENNLQLENNCIDWYLITTITYPNGTQQITEQYLFTTCNGCPMNGDMESVCEGSGGGNEIGHLPEPPEPVSKPKNWTVASGQVWRVYSDDILSGLRVANFPGGGYFTAISHSGSNVINYAGNEPGLPFSTWQEQASLPQVTNGGAAAQSYVKGLQRFYDGDEAIRYNTMYFLFNSEF